ncbi:succinate--CoA ligase subunit alpha [Halanaerobium sp. MA284_MarDTE_T2]|uniref:succinate--CoA ligase subunit alpha n=1 Tax=Halanaerobium sp. MA284_MarDTE_T2 TaxID=2183913 RepID=UPI000DF48C63|nr:succinate--CoA ligase subunit alpha [Halanaerobium sp. MA284_MarDTE_T2]RCW44386.1 succinyl-CoA synthetase (ADP-forming) alpha subunit [Halanaerobium sp. MA284_MarDTE_T2]
MSILVNKNTKVLVQGITGKIGRAQTKYMLDAGTNIVAGVTPGKEGTKVYGIPVYDTVKEAKENHDIDASVLFVPASIARECVIEAAKNKIKLITLITEHTPVHDVMEMKSYIDKSDSLLIGPTTPGIISPGECKIGILPTNMFTPGSVGVISRSGTLSYEVSAILSDNNIGQSTVVGMGADLVAGTNLIDILKLFNSDKNTKLVVLIGEVGGSQEEDAAEYIKNEMNKPVVAYIAGGSAPDGKRMGHAGAIVEGGKGSAESKISHLTSSGVKVVSFLFEIPEVVKKLLQ